VTAILVSCTSPSGTPSASPSVSEPSQEASPAMSTPSAVTPDPSRFGFTDAQPTVTEISSETTDGVTVTDLTFEEPGDPPTEAYLVAPVGAEPGPAIIWFHWVEYGSPTSNRTEFLEEARAMAARGAVSLLVQGTMPWLEPPESIAHDVATVEQEVRMLRRALFVLDVRPEVDNTRLAIVGHDFGAMYASLYFGADGHQAALVMMAPSARWADWFYRYWQISDPEDEYLAAMASLDPVTWLPLAAPRPVLLQFASSDEYVPASVAEEISVAAGSSAETRIYEGAGHHLNEEAMTDRDIWLAEQLGVSAP
jgi:dienelactone hydrolase